MMQVEAPKARAQQFVKVCCTLFNEKRVAQVANFSQGNTEDEDRLRQISPKWVEKYHIVDKIAGGSTNGFLDIFGGITLADKVF
jgi:hypothetical protein